jgi:hypothetical protein
MGWRMSINVTGRGCRLTHGHQADLDIYETLPREVRDALKIAESNLCCGCVRNSLRRFQRWYGPEEGLQMKLRELERWRRTEAVREGRHNVYYIREDLKP